MWVCPRVLYQLHSLSREEQSNLWATIKCVPFLSLLFLALPYFPFPFVFVSFPFPFPFVFFSVSFSFPVPFPVLSFPLSFSSFFLSLPLLFHFLFPFLAHVCSLIKVWSQRVEKRYEEKHDNVWKNHLKGLGIHVFFVHYKWLCLEEVLSARPLRGTVWFSKKLDVLSVGFGHVLSVRRVEDNAFVFSKRCSECMSVTLYATVLIPKNISIQNPDGTLKPCNRLVAKLR